MRSFKDFYNIYHKDLNPLFTGTIPYVIPAVSTVGDVLVPVNTYAVRSAIPQQQKTTYKIIIWQAYTIVRFGKKFAWAMTFHSHILGGVTHLKHILLSMSSNWISLIHHITLVLNNHQLIYDYWFRGYKRGNYKPLK